MRVQEVAPLVRNHIPLKLLLVLLGSALEPVLDPHVLDEVPQLFGLLTVLYPQSLLQVQRMLALSDGLFVLFELKVAFCK